MARVPKVFVSSTDQDLHAYREAARDAALKCRFLPVMSEYWAASGHERPLEACLATVRECDLVVAIVAHRYGWVPSGQEEGGHDSVTWLECKEAILRGKEVIAFLVDEEAPWPLELREEYAAAKALQKGIPSVEELTAMRRGLEGLARFKEWLRTRGIRATFRSPAELSGEIVAALNDWRLRAGMALGREDIQAGSEPTRYLRNLYEITRHIDIRGLQVGSGRAHQFPIEDLFIPVAFTGQGSIAESAPAGQDQMKELMRQRRVAIIGDPGSGKTTLLRRIAQALAVTWLRLKPDAAREFLGLEGEPPLPLFVRLFDLAQFIEAGRAAGAPDVPSSRESPEWLVDYLVQSSKENAWGLDEEFYRERLRQGGALVLLDGLDEAPSPRSRRILARLVESCSRAYESCQFILTSRPKAYNAETALTGFEKVEIQPLSETSVEVFIDRWCEALFRDTPTLGAKHRVELTRALAARPEIRRMASNPVMLTALAVVHWNEKRIPEQRSELYESIITWLSRAREDRPGRIAPEKSVRMLQTIALAMQDSEAGRQVEAPRSWAAGEISGYFPQEFAMEDAERFLVEEELDSGIVVARGDNIRFWHLSFQEYLAARALAALREEEQQRRLLGDLYRLLSAEWREVILLFAGILHRQGPKKVEAMLHAILEHEPPEDRLASRAQIAGLIGAIQRDLSSLDFRFTDPRYERMLAQVLEFFQPHGTGRLDANQWLEAAEALGQAGDPRLQGDNLIPLNGGRFLIGVQAESPLKASYDACALPTEGPVRRVELPAFSIARFPVTIEEYRGFVEYGGYEHRPYWHAGGFGLFRWPWYWAEQLRYPNRPVTGVSWYEAMAYCCWRGARTRLPAEAMWERAARGDSNRLFPWGDDFPDDLRLNYGPRGIGRPTPVGFFPLGATPEGVLDMAGNVFEWCLDAWSPTPDGSGIIADAAAHRVVRGGGFGSCTLFVRAAFRGHYEPERRAADLGFRICSL